jgi:hypothetical protein
MMTFEDSTNVNTIDRIKYKKLLAEFDAVACEALSVGNGITPRQTTWIRAYALRVFTRMCCHTVALMSALPLSRWAQKEFEFWDFAESAGHLRAVMEGYVLFRYLASAPSDPVVVQATSNLIFLYDCTTRMERLGGIWTSSEKDKFESEQDRIKGILLNNAHFLSLTESMQTKLLKGKSMTLSDKDVLLDQFGIKRKEYFMFWDLASQYMHVLSMAFMRMEQNGWGTGVENDADRGYIGLLLQYCLPFLKDSTDIIVSWYPELAKNRNGVKSKFHPDRNQTYRNKIMNHELRYRST